MAARFHACIHERDTVARLGGDEFVLLLNSPGSTDEVRLVLERMLATVTQPWMTEHGEYQVTCSIGVALYPDDGLDAQTLLKHADSAMYRAKDSGRNNFQFFTREINMLMTERLELEGKLRRALERDQFQLHYQPRVDLATGKILGAEALIRWYIPGRGTHSSGALHRLGPRKRGLSRQSESGCCIAPAPRTKPGRTSDCRPSWYP